MILYRKAPQLRIHRAAVPEPPYWAATTIAPYSTRRAAPLAIDYIALQATSARRFECAVSEEIPAGVATPPILIECTEWTEVVYRRGDAFVRESPLAMQLVSHAVPESHAYTIVTAWPFDLDRLDRFFTEVAGREWGVVIPIVFPVTTDLAALESLATLAQRHGARFLAALPIEIDAPGRTALAQALSLDEETYDTLFHADLEPLLTATERHIAALAHEINVADFIPPPQWSEKSNWNAAIVLMLAATRMIAMKHDVELASRIARSARAVAQLDKPIERIAAAASLSIIESLDETSVDILTEWLETGRSAFADHVNKQWRLRRDAGV